MASTHKMMMSLTEEEHEDLDNTLYVISCFLQSLSINLARRYGRKVYDPGFAAQNRVNELRNQLDYLGEYDSRSNELDIEGGLEFIRNSKAFFAEALDDAWIIDGFKGFLKWVLMQKNRDDPVGDVARDLFADIEMKRAKGEHLYDYASGYREFRKYLVKRGACSEAVEAVDEAWREYKATKKNAKTA